MPVPQIPALAFSLARLARFGPWFVEVLDFLMPAPALAVDQREPNASLLEEADLVGGLVLVVVEERGELNPLRVVVEEEEVDWGALLGTEMEVK